LAPCEWKDNKSNYYQCGGANVPEEKGVNATGVFPFTIKMRNELRGIDQTLFAGKVKIDKAPDDSGTPAELSRSTKFAVGSDGQLAGGAPVLYTVRWADGDRQPGVVVPVAVLDGQDGPWDRNAWKADGFYGNPLNGVAPAP